MSAYVVERPRLDARMMNLGFSYTSPVHSQSAHAYATMSRSPKRKLPESPIRKSVLHNYLKSLNSMTRSIVLETETVEEEHRKNWTSMNETKREEVVNDHFIPSGVRDQYDCRSWRRPPPMVLKTSGDSSRLHLSQPSSWAEWNEYQDSQDDLVLRNHVASWTNNDFSLSQPPCEPQSQPATFSQDYRLHKKQLSFRPHNAVNRPSPLPQPRVLPRERLGSDGESPRTSDEDSCVNPLGFHRSKLRSYSMRPKRGNVRNNHLRSSARYRPASPDSNRKAYLEERSRPSHYVNLQSFRQDFDVEVDLPDDSLLLDHVHEPGNETTMRQPTQRPLRYSARGRRTNQFIDQSSTDETDALLSNSEKEPESTTSFSTNSSDSMLITSDECSNAEVICNRFPMSPSHESLDFDDVSIAPSNISASQSVMSKDDELLRVSTPDSMLSGSSCSYRSKSKYADIAIMRNPRGKRGGSSYKMTTSNYTDRHTQFKPNMLRKQKLNSAQNSPAIRSTPVPQEGMEEDCLSQSFLKPPALVLPSSKYGSVTESETTDLPSSPDQLSEICSPFIQTGLVPENKRESGYLSTASSCESFAIRR